MLKFLQFILLLYNDWNYFFGDTDITSNNLYNTTRLTFSGSENVSISECSFYDIETTGNGGAVLFQPGNNKDTMLIDYSTFLNCSCTENGGAVYMDSKRGQCVLQYVCGNACKANTDDNFIRSSITNSQQNKNFVYDSCIMKTINPSTYVIWLGYGDMQCKLLNISHNYVNSDSAICFQGPATGTIGLISYCYINNNTAKSFCIRLWTSWNYRSNNKIDTCNIISNEGNELINCNYATATIVNSAIFGNIKNNVFSGYYSYKIILYNCSTDVTTGYTISSFVITNEDMFFLNGFKFIETGMCAILYGADRPFKPNKPHENAQINKTYINRQMWILRAVLFDFILYCKQ